MTTSERPLDIVVLGAYGRTARECAEYIATQLPSNLKWAIAGRNAGKLQALAEKLKGMNSDRLQPEVAILELNPKDLGALARKCRVIINGVAPYCLHSLPVVEACATNGTHYLDL
ncbi:MAG: hypothetical protein M1834_005008 [Cirrosporium novae-zelandiae]|nr:MAG: hypothetical protein M1834_005008 [Cirrosporium novae-zelandiae]